MMRRKNGAEHVKAQAESGLSMAEYCRREGIAANSFYNWKKKFQSMSGFVKMNPAIGKIELELSNGAKVLVSEDNLSKVLGALNGL